MKKLLILIMLAIMVTFVAFPVIANACGGCFDAMASIDAEPYGGKPIARILDVSGGDQPIAARAALGKLTYIDIATTLIGTGGGGGEAASVTVRKYHIQTATRTISARARDRPSHSGGHATIETI